MPVLRFDHVSKDYAADGEQVHALRDVSFAVEPGQFIALMGRSGCGKSTLLHLAGAMDFPTSGTVEISGQPTSGLSDFELTRMRRTLVGFVFQSFQLLPNLSVAENVELPLLLAGTGNARERALATLDWVELAGLGARLPHQLSGGQMQRVAMARALVHEPRLLLADEPIGNLDTATGDLILELMRRAAAERGAAILMATHSLESTTGCDTVFRMRDGRIES
jgi:ABC-type lipoprotein export system ATPase subunit